MTTTDVKKLYCECYAVAIMGILQNNKSGVFARLSAIPGGMFCAKVVCQGKYMNFILNDVTVRTYAVDGTDVCMEIGKGHAQSRDASDFIEFLYEYGTYPMNEDMLTIDYIKTWRTLLSAMPYTADARKVIDRIDSFLERV